MLPHHCIVATALPLHCAAASSIHPCTLALMISPCTQPQTKSAQHTCEGCGCATAHPRDAAATSTHDDALGADADKLVHEGPRPAAAGKRGSGARRGGWRRDCRAWLPAAFALARMAAGCPRHTHMRLAITSGPETAYQARGAGQTAAAAAVRAAGGTHPYHARGGGGAHAAGCSGGGAPLKISPCRRGSSSARPAAILCNRELPSAPSTTICVGARPSMPVENAHALTGRPR